MNPSESDCRLSVRRGQKLAQSISVHRHPARILATTIATAALVLLTPRPSPAASITWNGTTDALWATTTDWSTGAAPATGDTAVFNNSGNGNTTLGLGSGVTVSTLLFDTSSAAAYTIGAGAVNSQTLTLNNAGAITLNSTVAANQLINAAIVLGTDATTSTYTFTNNSTTNTLTLAGNLTGGSSGTAGTKTLTVTGAGNTNLSGSLANGGATAVALTKSGTGTLTLSGANSNTGTTTISNGTLKLGANNALTTTGNVTLSTGGITNILDLAGFSQTIGTLTSGNTTDSAGLITSSAAGGSLTITGGTTSGNTFGGTRFTGTLALTISGTNLTSSGSNNYQMTNANNTFSGGLTIKSSGSSSLSSSNLATAGGLATGSSSAGTEGLRINSSAALGTGSIALDNGQLFAITGVSAITNNISVTARGGVIHAEVNGTTFSGTLSSTASTFVMVASNSGNTNILKFTGDDSAFSGTMAIDTTNIGGISFGGSAVGNSNTNLLWFGNGSNGGTGRVQYGGTSSGTLTFGELNNLNSGSVGSTMSGIIEDATASTTATLSLGDTNTTAATFQGVIRNGSGTVALTKTGTNTQILSGANTYTGATTVNGGTLKITGSLAAGSAVAINNGGTLIAGSGGTVAGSVAVNGGGALGGAGTVSGAVTVAAGSTASTEGAINLVDGALGTLTLSNAAGLTLGGTSGNSSLLNFEVGSSTSDQITLGSNALTLNAGGAAITITSLGVVAGQTYTLMSFGSGSGAGFVTGSGAAVLGGLTLTNPSISFGVTGTLTVLSNMIELVTSGASAPATAYWSGAKGSTWAANDGVGGNFTTTNGGSTFVSAYPSSTTDVFFTNSASVTNTLGTGFDIKSLTFSGAGTTTTTSDGNTLTIESGGLTVASGAGAVSLGANIAGPGTITNSSLLTLSGTNTYTGGTTNTAGTLTAGSSTAFGASTSPLTVNGGTVDLNGNSVTVGALGGSGGTITNNSSSTNVTLVESNSSTSTYSGVLANGSSKTLALTKNGTGTLVLSGNNTYSGVTNINAGTIQLGSATALGTSATTIASGAALDFNGQTISNVLTVQGSGISNGGALLNSNTTTAGALTSDITGASSFTVGGAGNLTLQRVQSSGIFTLTKQGAGTLNLGNASTTNHDNLLALDVEAGTVNLGMTGTLIAIDRGLIINGGSTVNYSGTSTNMLSDADEVRISNGTLNMNGVSDTAGKLTIGNGTTNGNLSGTGTFTVSANYNSFATNTIASSTIEAMSGTVSVGLAGAVPLNKTTSGTVTLSGSNTYTGATSVKAGALIINGSLSSSSTVTIGDSANLTTAAVLAANTSGSTTNVGPVVLGAAAGNTGATLSPGNGSNGVNGAGALGALLTVNGNLTITSGSGAHLQLAVGRTSAGTDTNDVSDRVTVTGSISLAGDLEITLLSATGYTLAQGDELYLIVNNGSSAVSGTFDTVNGVGSGIAQDSIFGVGSTFFQISYTASTTGGAFDGGGTSVALLVVPEPSSLALLAGAGTLALFRRRRC
ncbi:MAG: autotransporter-associated beta strand repeat-containing protein [Chthoniobacteraceae bacterium]